MSRGKQKAMTSFQRAILTKEDETPSNHKSNGPRTMEQIRLS
jgi:hypothetical protein